MIEWFLIKIKLINLIFSYIVKLKYYLKDQCKNFEKRFAFGLFLHTIPALHNFNPIYLCQIKKIK